MEHGAFLSEVLAQIRARAAGPDVEAALGWYFEAGACGVSTKVALALDAHKQLATGHAHALGSFGAKVVLTWRDHADAGFAPVALEADALNVAFEIAVVFDNRWMYCLKVL